MNLSMIQAAELKEQEKLKKQNQFILATRAVGERKEL